MSNAQPKPESKSYSDLISEIQKGKIKVPKFQRNFVWSIENTAGLLDSILKGYPIGTFILWKTKERLNAVKNIGNLDIPETPEGEVQYVLDGQQRMTSLYAAFLGAKIQKEDEKKITDYLDIFVDLDADIDDTDNQIISPERPIGNSVRLSEVLNLDLKKLRAEFDNELQDKIIEYSLAFKTYEFSTVMLRKDDIDSAIEVFTRINTGGQSLTLFEIMSAKTYDEAQDFDMQKKWETFIEKLKKIGYEGISSSVILNLIGLDLSRTKECKRKVVLALEKERIIDSWDRHISAIEEAIQHFRTIYLIPVSNLLPYDSLLVPFAYFYLRKAEPTKVQRKLLEEFFWRMSLSSRYSSASESKLAQDIKRIEKILVNERPEYSEVKISLDSAEELSKTNFSAGNSYCKAILCLLAAQEPKDFNNNSKVILNNDYLKIAYSKNYHHFFPRSYLINNKIQNENSLMNITLVSDKLNKKKIGSRAPSDYIAQFADENPVLSKTLISHLIELQGFGIESDDYGTFLLKRAERVFKELKSRIELQHDSDEHFREGFLVNGENDKVEFKSSLRFDLRQGSVNSKLEFSVAKTIAAFMNSDGGELYIGVDDNGNILGIEQDIATLPKKNIDGFSLHLGELVKKSFGAEKSTHVKIEFISIDDVQICKVTVSRMSKPAFLTLDGKDEFYIRSNASSIPLSRTEQSIYEKEHFI